MRYPAVAGQFYSGNPEELRRQVENCYKSPIGPGHIPQLKKGPRTIRGVVCPHAGFMYSGPVAAHVFNRLADDGFPKTFVILGPKHREMGAMVATTTEDFSMPMGVVPVDQDLARKMVKGIVSDDLLAHRFEHSLEVQLPFIQHLSPETKIVPICMGLQDYDTAKEVGKIVRRETEGKDVVIVASTDFSHYVPQDVAKRKDQMAIDRILDLDPKGLYKTVLDENITMCGYGPVMAMLVASEGKEAELLKYSTSGDVEPMRQVVGYAGIVVKG